MTNHLTLDELIVAIRSTEQKYSEDTPKGPGYDSYWKLSHDDVKQQITALVKETLGPDKAWPISQDVNNLLAEQRSRANSLGINIEEQK